MAEAVAMVATIGQDPVNVAYQLIPAYAALQRATEAAGYCDDICRLIVEKACNQSHILCKLLTVGKLYPDSHGELNAALLRCLASALEEIQGACDVMYEYIQHSRFGRLTRAQETKHKLKMAREFMNDRFNDIHTHVSLATYLQQREGLQTVLPVVAAVEALRSDLHALKTLSATDHSRMQAIASAAVKRKREQGQVVLVDRKGRRVDCMAVSPDGRCFACTSDKHVSVWDAETGHLVQTLQGHTGRVIFVSWSPRSEMLASCSGDKTVRVWDVAAGITLHNLQGHSDWVQCVAWSPCGGMLVSCSHDESVRVWEAATGITLHNLQGHSDWVQCVAWSPCGGMLALGPGDKTVRVWKAATGTTMHNLQGLFSGVRCVAWSPCSGMLASCCDDKRVRVWEAATGTTLHDLQGHSDRVRCVAWSPDGSLLASGSGDKTVRIYDIATGATKCVIKSGLQQVECVAWSPCGRLLFAATWGGRVHIFRAGAGQFVV
jgi:WD40 repeat protein